MFENPGDWAFENGVRIGIILVLAIALHFFLRRVIPRAVALAMQPHQQEDDEASQRQRADTISTVFVRTADVLIIVLAALLVLGEVGVSLAPFIAGAAVAAGADGLIVEAHPEPDASVSDAAQALSATQLEQLMVSIQPLLQAMGRGVC